MVWNDFRKEQSGIFIDSFQRIIFNEPRCSFNQLEGSCFKIPFHGNRNKQQYDTLINQYRQKKMPIQLL